MDPSIDQFPTQPTFRTTSPSSHFLLSPQLNHLFLTPHPAWNQILIPNQQYITPSPNSTTPISKHPTNLQPLNPAHLHFLNPLSTSTFNPSSQPPFSTSTSSTALQTRTEAGLPRIRTIAEEEGANLLSKIECLPEGHHLKPLLTPVSRPRLKSRGETTFRPDRRSVSRKRLDKVGPGQCVRHKIRDDTIDIEDQFYYDNMDQESFHARATKGKRLPQDENRTRKE